MSEVKQKHKEWILETIDQLKKRKNRPDLERICMVLMRKHGLSLEDIVSDLEKLVDQKVVLKVEFKGQISYRNAAKQAKYRSHSGDELKDKILASFMKWAKTETDSDLDGGHKTISLAAFERWLTENDTEMFKCAVTKESLTLAVNKLLVEGKLIETKSGLYSVVLDEDMADMSEGESTMEGKEKQDKNKVESLYSPRGYPLCIASHVTAMCYGACIICVLCPGLVVKVQIEPRCWCRRQSV